MTRSFPAHPLGSTREARPFVPDAEDVAVRAVLNVVKKTVLLFLAVLRAAGIQLLEETKVHIESMKDKQVFPVCSQRWNTTLRYLCFKLINILCKQLIYQLTQQFLLKLRSILTHLSSRFWFYDLKLDLKLWFSLKKTNKTKLATGCEHSGAFISSRLD